MPDPVVSERYGRILCDDEIEDEIVTKIEAWILAYQAEVERQRGWDARELEAPFQVVPASLLEHSVQDVFSAPLPVVAVRVERVVGEMVSATREASMDWRVLVEVYAKGADDADVRKRLRAYVAAVRALLWQQGGTGPVVTMMRYVASDYTPFLTEKGVTVGGGVIEFTAGVEGAVRHTRNGLVTPPVDPYAVPSGLVEVVDTTTVVSVL